jgi:hypothetical protein
MREFFPFDWDCPRGFNPNANLMTPGGVLPPEYRCLVTISGIKEGLTGELTPGVPDLLARVDLLVDEGDALTLVDVKTARSKWTQPQVQDSAGQFLP